MMKMSHLGLELRGHLNLAVWMGLGRHMLVVDGPSAICMLVLILLSWEALWTKSESYSGDFL